MQSRPQQRRPQSSTLARRLALALGGLAALALAAGCDDEPDVVIVAITRTPQPAAAEASTSVVPQPPTADTETPVPASSAALPEPPESLLAGANLLVPYLAGGGADMERCLPELVAAWEFAAAEEPRCVFADLDGDGAREFALLVTLPGDEDTQPGDVWFFGSAEQGHRLLDSARSLANSALGGVRIVAADDLTGDGLPEVVVASLSCGGVICTTDFLIVSAHRGRLEDLAPEKIEITGLEDATVEEATGDGQLDLVLRGGVITSAAAGPPRPFRNTLSWSGLRFFVDEQPDPTRYLFHAIVDADALFASGDYAGARERYELAAADATLADWKAEIGSRAGRAELTPYALFRAGIAALRQGEGVAGRVLLERAFREHARSLHGTVAASYLSALIEGKTLGEACVVVEALLTGREAEFAEAWDYGYANPEHTIAGLCR